MSAIEESVNRPGENPPKERKTAVDPFGNAISAVIDFLSSVKFGVVLLCILVLLSIIGMVVIQQNVQGFDAYYASLTPAEKTVYGSLGLFNIYYSWYFNLILLILSLNIILASIDRFPSAWNYIVDPKKFATKGWFLNRDQSEELVVEAESADTAVENVKKAFSASGFSAERITAADLSEADRVRMGLADKDESESPVFLFAEKGKWNRLGAYIVHVSLLTLFLGHFVAFQTGFDADVNMMPGQASNEIQLIEINLDQQERYSVQLPFTITCVDIQQKLIDPNGSIEVFNTLDWITRIRIDDPQYGVTERDVSLNNPYSYRGYRFFQAQTVPIGSARTMTLQVTPDGGETQTVKLDRNGTAILADGTLVEYESFQPDFTFNSQGNPDTRSSDYNNPVAVLLVTPKGGEKSRVFAFGTGISDDLPVAAPKLGYKWRMESFEKSPLAHVLSIKYDPYNGAFIAWYFGGFGLIFALMFVFFYSHRRLWAMIGPKNKDGSFDVVIAGDTNRNHFAFEDKFKKIAESLKTRNEPEQTPGGQVSER